MLKRGVTTVLIDDKTELQPALDYHKFESDLKILANYAQDRKGAKKVYQRGLGVHTFYTYDKHGYPLFHTDSKGREYRYIFYQGELIYRNFSHKDTIFINTYKHDFKLDTEEEQWYWRSRSKFEWVKVSAHKAENDIKNGKWGVYQQIKESVHSSIIPRLKYYFSMSKERSYWRFY